MTYKNVVPILYSSDIEKSIAYYKDKLGFEDSWKWDDPPTFGAVIKDAVEIFFCKECQGKPGTWLSIFIDDVDAFYDMANSKGAKILCPPENMEWGIREMLVEDPDGHRIRFGQNAQGSDKELIAGRLPENIRIVTRESPSAVYVCSVEAEDLATGNIVGSVSLISDTPGFYYVKNLMVEPEWQHKRIGSALMQELTSWLNQNAPDNSSVYLHTGENLGPFYKQFGFMPVFGMYRRIKKAK